jgi:hypothetical protein
LWSTFDQAAVDEGKTTSGDTPSIKQAANKHAWKTYALFALNKWPLNRGRAPNRIVDVVVQVEEDIHESGIVKATTQLGYYEFLADRRKPVLDPLLEIHYDFSVPGDEAHPLFHMQLGEPRFPRDLASLQLSADFGERRGPAPYEAVRVPTAFMGYAQVLVALAADYLAPSRYRKVYRKAIELQGFLHAPQCGDLHDRLTKRTVPHAHLWYDVCYDALIVKNGKHGFSCGIPALGGAQVSAKDRNDLCDRVLSQYRLAEWQVNFIDG